MDGPEAARKAVHRELSSLRDAFSEEVTQVLTKARLNQEIATLDRLIDEGFEQNLPMIELCAAYQALKWVCDPEGYAPPTSLPGRPKPKLKLIINERMK